MLAKQVLLVLVALAAGIAGNCLNAADDPTNPTLGRKLRVGVYDSRSVALAYLRSQQSLDAIDQLVAEGKQAEEANDQGRLEMLKTKANARQNLHHMQVFGNAPIHDILVELKAILEEQARAKQLDLIVRDVDIAFRRPDVELVDITGAIVESCQPSQETLKIIDQMKHHPPLPLEQFPIEHEHGEKNDPASHPTAEADAVTAAKAWLELIDSGKYEDSWKESSAHFQAVVPRLRWVGEMAELRTPLGKLISREVMSHVYRTDLPDAPIGEYVVIQFKTECENDKEVIESVTPVREADGTWKVDGYYIR